MSTTVKRQNDGALINYAKGADMAIVPRILNLDSIDQELVAALNIYASTGLRTLMFSSRILPDNIDHENITAVEKDYELLGITGVEDLLQDNVKDCIEQFMQASIKVWMLTGDKGATARNIGQTCGILSDTMNIHQIDEEKDVKQQLQSILSKLPKVTNSS